MNLNAEQKEVLRRVDALIRSDDQNELLVTGESGTGKSYTTKAIIKYIADRQLMAEMVGAPGTAAPMVYLTASTNKAAGVLASFAEADATTIHSFLALRPQVDYETGDCRFLPSDNTIIQRNAVIIVDEMSFVDSTTYKIIQEMTSNCKLIWIGDHYQLKPVKSKYIPVYQNCNNIVELTDIMRNQGEIQQLGRDFRRAIDTKEFPKLMSGGNVTVMGRDAYRDKIEDTFGNNEDARIVAWRNDTVLSYNQHVQEDILNRKLLTVGGTYTVNDGIVGGGANRIYFPTDSEVTLIDIEGQDDNSIHIKVQNMHGDISTLYFPKLKDGKRKMMRAAAAKKDWPLYYNIKDNYLDLRLPYASTINKAQGSTHDVIFMDLGDILECRNLDTLYRMLYVGATRARKHLYIYDSLHN